MDHRSFLGIEIAMIFLVLFPTVVIARALPLNGVQTEKFPNSGIALNGMSGSDRSEESFQSLKKMHSEHIMISAPFVSPYSTNLNYTLLAKGVATTSSPNGTLSSDAQLTLVLSTWKSTDKIAWLDVLNGTLRIGSHDLVVQSAKGYYLVSLHQFRIFARTIGSDVGNQGSVLRIAAVVQNNERLGSLDSDRDVMIRVIGFQNTVESHWRFDMQGDVKLSNEISSINGTKSKVTLNAILDNLGEEQRFRDLIGSALQKLRDKHPELEINVVENQFPYPNEKTQLIESVSNGTSIDLMSIDQIWLGELAERGLLSDLTNYTNSWGRSSDWYQSNWDGGAYKGKTYAIWVWTDVRGMYYWKDMFENAGVNPDSLKTWDGYISAAKILNAKLRPQGIEGVHLTGASHSPDIWYPYLWMLGGDIVEQRSGHPTKGVYWYPAYNSSQGVQALTFIKDQIDAGIVPQKNHSWGKEFQERKFAVMIEASHVPGYFQLNNGTDLDKVGFMPMFPVPNATVQTTTLMGGWELAVPVTSQHKQLSWELIALMVDPNVLAPWLAKYNYLPTQLPIGQGAYAEQLRKNNPFFDDMASLIQYGRSRPSIAEYPQIAEHVREAIDDVYYGRKDPKQALDDAAAKSAIALGWVQ